MKYLKYSIVFFSILLVWGIVTLNTLANTNHNFPLGRYIGTYSFDPTWYNQTYSFDIIITIYENNDNDYEAIYDFKPSPGQGPLPDDMVAGASLMEITYITDD